jgi:glycosyltransferase involved in cell wall biosynthesis
LVSVPSVRIPFRAEYRFSRGLPDRLKQDVRDFAPDIIHLSTPDPLNHAAKALARELGVPAVASFHTRFDTYFRYYGAGWFEGMAKRIMQRFYAGLDEVFVTSEGFGDVLKADGIIDHAAVWSRGVDKLRFSPAKRNLAWRRGLGIADDDVVIGFVGRLVLEKGLDVVAAAVAELQRRGVPHKLLVVGDGPARSGFEAQVPGAIFTGFLDGETLARAYASADMLLNPSITETFGNINLEAMASGIPIVAAIATGSNCLIEDGVNGRLVPATDIPAFADALTEYLTDESARKAAGAEGLRIAAGYNWDAINGAVLARYRELVAA